MVQWVQWPRCHQFVVARSERLKINDSVMTRHVSPASWPDVFTGWKGPYNVSLLPLNTGHGSVHLVVSPHWHAFVG